jgi:bifunctional non-homologous end joining protein LigD
MPRIPSISPRRRSLATYKAKRDFAKTPEPSGNEKPKRTKPATKSKGLFFCVQKHLASHLHYDFRLEYGGVLLSWAVPKGPSVNPTDKRLAMRVEDHPFDYGEFEGVIPEGYGAGIVLLWDKGIWCPEPGFEDIDAGLRKGELKFTLDGVKLKGSWVLVRTNGSPRGDDGQSRSWLLIKHRDAWAGAVDVATNFPQSVKSFGDFADILAADKPDVWKSHRPAEGGAAGAMLREIIEKAAKLKLAKEKGVRGERLPRRAPVRTDNADRRRRASPTPGQAAGAAPDSWVLRRAKNPGRR